MEITGQSIYFIDPKIEEHDLDFLNKPNKPPLKKFPLVDGSVYLDIKGVTTAIAHGITRVIMNNIEGARMNFDKNNFKSSYPFMTDRYVQTRLNLVPIRYNTYDGELNGLELALHITNKSHKFREIFTSDIIISKGKVSYPIYNPAYHIATIDGGSELHIDNIRIDRGISIDDATFNVTYCNVTIPLDAKKRDNLDEVIDGVNLMDTSGYVESSLVANPKHHRIKFIISDMKRNDIETPKKMLNEACIRLKDKLIFLQGIISGGDFDQQSDDFKHTYMIDVPGEEDTLGNIVARTSVDMNLDCTYTYDKNSDILRLIFSDEEVSNIKTIKEKALVIIGDIIKIYENIRTKMNGKTFTIRDKF